MMTNNDEVVYAVGPEVENTPVFSKKTLFVNGIRSTAQMIEFAEEHSCVHVCLGAFDSFQKNKKWDEIIRELLDAGLRVSLHFPAEANEFVLDSLDTSVWSHPYFIPVIVVKVKWAEERSKNLMIKIGDGTPNQLSNLGVWTIPMREVLDSNRFTDHKEFDNITPIYTVSELKKLKDK